MFKHGKQLAHRRRARHFVDARSRGIGLDARGEFHSESAVDLNFVIG
jgi:hypothetical protein